MFSCARSRRCVASIAVVVSMSLLVAAAPPSHRTITRTYNYAGFYLSTNTGNWKAGFA